MRLCLMTCVSGIVALSVIPTNLAGPAGERVLIIRGAERSGGLGNGTDARRTSQLADINDTSTNGSNTGWGEFAALLTGAGYQVEQMIEPLEANAPSTGSTTGAPIEFDTLQLSQYDAIIFGSNNAVYGDGAIDAIENYVRSGGALCFLADANFGSDWADASTSDQQFLDRFGWTMQQDQSTYVLRRSDGDFLVPDHPILTGVDAFDGEGVSPIVVPATDTAPGVTTTLVVRAKPGQNTRNNDNAPGQGSSRPVGPQDAALAVATVDGGRLVGHIDRNTFFNANGAGTSLVRFDNTTYALNLLAWMMSETDPACVTTVPTTHQPLTLEFSSVESFDELTGTNPFLDRRLQVLFTSPSGTSFDVPGYFGGDGTTWRVHFTPNEPGRWTWSVSFRAGIEVAVDLDPMAGSAAEFDGASGAVLVQPADADAPGFLAKGKLLYAGDHYLRFANGERFLKVGADSPENWLGYRGFDNTFDGGAGPSTPDGLHAFPTHVADWQAGDPDWDSPDTPEPNDGRAIIGALNYIASTGVNTIYFLPMNIGGDGRDSWPYASPSISPTGSPANNNLRFDNSKLEQWGHFFDHAQAKGILLHFVLTEAETANKNELDNATLGVERKLYYRELIARFAHHNAIQWNISEEYNLNLNLGSAAVLEFGAYLKAVDPYGSPVTVHNAGNLNNPVTGPWGPFIGQPDIDLTSLQQARRIDGWGGVVESFRDATADAGMPIPIMIDEPGSPTRDFDNDFNAYRKRVVWPVLMSGGGVECFINDRDQSLEDFREFDQIWREMGYARTFFEDNLPFWEMEPDDALVTGASDTFDGAEVLAKTGEQYAIYFPDATMTGTIELPSEGAVALRWFDPRSGVFDGPERVRVATAATPIGPPPSDPGEDWGVIITTGACLCSFNTDPTQLTIGDVLAFLQPWFAGDASADLTGDGATNIADLLAFLECWFSGVGGVLCPQA